jgi:hypothetical protein
MMQTSVKFGSYLQCAALETLPFSVGSLTYAIKAQFFIHSSFPAIAVEARSISGLPRSGLPSQFKFRWRFLDADAMLLLPQAKERGNEFGNFPRMEEIS